MQRIAITTNRTALFLLASIMAFGAGGDKTQTKGMIMSRTGETLTVSSSEGKTTVVLTDDTKTKDDKGLFGLGKQELSSVVLIPGLKVKVDGNADDQGRVVAKTITVDGDDLETAEMIQSGLHPTAQQVAANVQTLEAHQQGIAANQQGIATNQQGIAANQQGIAANQQNIATHTEKIEQNMKDIQENTDRFNALSDFDVKGQATVKFKVGSSKISPADEEQIKQLAQTATSLTGYIVEVMGYTDATGSAAMNTKLSEERAKAVVTYLVQQGSVPIRHIVAPGAMGEYGPAASNESRQGRAENRRVDVKILVNKGIAGS
jgi:outer membrane protein OmpA-like peptidoglycan-associated protein